MDLNKIKRKLEASRERRGGSRGGGYSSREKFFRDVTLCFENAIKFHSPNQEMAWLIDYSKQMVSITHKVWKKADKLIDDRNKVSVEAI